MQGSLERPFDELKEAVQGDRGLSRETKCRREFHQTWQRRLIAFTSRNPSAEKPDDDRFVPAEIGLGPILHFRHLLT